MATIQVTDFIRQDATCDPTQEESAAAYLVIGLMGEERLFHDFNDAQSFAVQCLEDSSDELEAWDVFPLYAAEPIQAT